MKPLLAAKVIAALQPMMPNLLRHIIGIDVTTPGTIAGRFGFEDEKFAAERLLKSWRDRIATPIAGLFLCGGAAEPVNAVSGRAGRIAARVALSSGR
jgi:phytoene dehydrogenase-like protein